MGLSGWHWGAIDGLGTGEGCVIVAGPFAVLSGDSFLWEDKTSFLSLPSLGLHRVTLISSPDATAGAPSWRHVCKSLAVARSPVLPPSSECHCFLFLRAERTPQDGLSSLPSPHQCFLSPGPALFLGYSMGRTEDTPDPELVAQRWAQMVTNNQNWPYDWCAQDEVPTALCACVGFDLVRRVKHDSSEERTLALRLEG